MADEMFDRMKVKTFGQASSVTSQKSLIAGFDRCLENTGSTLDTLNVQAIPPYPKYPNKWYGEMKWSRNGHSKDVSVGFYNRKIIRHIFQRKGLIQEAKRWVAEVPKSEKIVVVIYEAILKRFDACRVIKRLHQNTECCLIVPDIPEFVGSKGNFVKRTLKRVRDVLISKRLKDVDKFIFYAETMADYYKITRDRYIVVEGAIDFRDVDILSRSETNNDCITFLYSGSVSRKRGVPELINGFTAYKNNNVKLWITGAGDYDDEIKEVCRKDQRITHYGFLQTRKEVLIKEAEADVLLHIRKKDEPSSTYCFPSKLFEYFASGKPVISVRIPGIPEEYYRYLIEIEDLKPASIKEAFDKVVQMSEFERRRFGLSGKDFVLREKNSEVQARKILDFIS